MAEKILVVDDDVDTINYLRTVLSQQGYQVLSSENGMQALKLAHSEQPDLIVLDVMMPNMDGYEVARSLRRHPGTATIPILMFTAKTQIEDKVAGYEAGVNIYLTKPVHPVELQANIKALLLQRQTQVESTAEQGYMVGVLSAKGGLGVSTLALNLAVAFHQKQNVPVLAAELRPGQGTWAEELGMANSDGLTNLLRMDSDAISEAKVEEQLVLTPYGVSLLLASDKSCDFDCILATHQLEAILRQLPFFAALVVLDIGTNFLPAFDQVTELCKELILVTEPQPLAVKRTRLLIDELKDKGYGSSKVLNIVIVNRLRSDMSLSLSQVEETLGKSVTLGIPPATEQAYFATVNSRPLILVQPEGLVAQQFLRLAEQVALRVPKIR